MRITLRPTPRNRCSQRILKNTGSSCAARQYSLMVNIQEARPSALDQIVSVHERTFPGFLLTMLGSTFLRTYYEIALENTGTVALVAQGIDGSTVGFLIGHVAPQEFYA